jgi:hypothetical protein
LAQEFSFCRDQTRTGGHQATSKAGKIRAKGALMAWRWRNKKGDRGFDQPSFEAARENAVCCAIAMGKGKKSLVLVETPEPKTVILLWASLQTAGWRIEEHKT